MTAIVETERLILREWRAADAEEFARVTDTPAVMAHLGGVAGPAEVAAACRRQQAMQVEHGHCFWLVERRADGVLLGFCGLAIARDAPIAGEIEIGWRLREDAWGQGYAREAALASLAWGWANLAVPRIIAITVAANRPSRGLMERIGMTRRPDLDFDHPRFPAGSPLHRHIAYVAERPPR